MRAAKRASTAVLALAVLVGLAFVALTVRKKHHEDTLYMGKWVLNADRMVDAMVERGVPAQEVRSFYEANRGGATRLDVLRTEVRRVRSGKSVVASYQAMEVAPGCWRMAFAGGSTENWCVTGPRLSITFQDGRIDEYRRAGAGQMVSDSKPLN